VVKKSEAARERILRSAKEEFLRRGFAGASLRDIAAGAALSTGAIYRYFKNKDGLFAALVGPVTALLNGHFQSEAGAYMASLDSGRPFAELLDKMAAGILSITDFIYGHFDVMRLLACGSAGSSFEHFFDDLIQKDVVETQRFIKKAHRGRSNPPVIEDAHLAIMTRLTYKAVLEVVVRRMSRKEAGRYISVLAAFMQAGWGRILEGGTMPPE
jgi:AcrR family transcriptional regulator